MKNEITVKQNDIGDYIIEKVWSQSKAVNTIIVTSEEIPDLVDRLVAIQNDDDGY